MQRLYASQTFNMFPVYQQSSICQSHPEYRQLQLYKTPQKLLLVVPCTTLSSLFLQEICPWNMMKKGLPFQNTAEAQPWLPRKF